jgi:hypothetical protein
MDPKMSHGFKYIFLLIIITATVLMLNEVAEKQTHCLRPYINGNCIGDFPAYDTAYRNTPHKPLVIEPHLFTLREATYTEALQLLVSDDLQWASYNASKAQVPWIPSVKFVDDIRQVVFESDYRISSLQSAWLADRTTVAMIIVLSFICAALLFQPSPVFLLLAISVILTIVIPTVIHAGLPHNEPTSAFVECRVVSDMSQPCVPLSKFDQTKFVSSAISNFDVAQRMSSFGFTELVCYAVFAYVLVVAAAIIEVTLLIREMNQKENEERVSNADRKEILQVITKLNEASCELGELGSAPQYVQSEDRAVDAIKDAL